MARKLTIALVVLFGLLALGSSRPSFEDDESFANGEEAEEAFDEEEARIFQEQVARAYHEVQAEMMSQLQETRRSQERPPILLQSSHFCRGKKDGNYADVSNPRAFYMCDKAGQTWTMNCQAGLVFDERLNRCEWASGGRDNVKQTVNNYVEPAWPQPPPPPPGVEYEYGPSGTYRVKEQSAYGRK